MVENHATKYTSDKNLEPRTKLVVHLHIIRRNGYKTKLSVNLDDRILGKNIKPYIKMTCKKFHRIGYTGCHSSNLTTNHKSSLYVYNNKSKGNELSGA